MSLLDIFHISKIKEENETLKSLMTPELQDAVNLTNHIKELQNQEAALNQSISEKNTTLLSLDNEIADLKKLIILMMIFLFKILLYINQDILLQILRNIKTA